MPSYLERVPLVPGIFAMGAITALAPLAWMPFFDETGGLDLDLGTVILLGWQVLPFGVLAAALPLLGRRVSIVALVLIIAATAAIDVTVLLYPSSSTDALAILWIPIWLSVGVGLLIGLTSLARTVRGWVKG